MPTPTPTPNHEGGERLSCYECGCDLGPVDNPDDEARYGEDDESRCPDCHEEYLELMEDDRSGVNSHDYKPDARFHRDDGSATCDPEVRDGLPMMYFGVELETEVANGDFNEGVDLCNQYNRGLFYLKADGSLDHGFEIVTHPMSLAFVQNRANSLWTTMNALRRNGFRSWQTSTCGLHIHMSRNAFKGDSHEQKFLYFLYNEENTDALVKFAGRRSHWAKFRKDLFLGINEHREQSSLLDEDGLAQGFAQARARGTIMDIVKGYRKDGTPVDTQWERYLAVNRQNWNTYELRFFRPSLQPHALQACVEFCAAVYDYTHQVTANAALKHNGLNWAEFSKWVQRDEVRERYSRFVPRWVARVHNGVILGRRVDDGGYNDIIHG
jgi:hypothetical protein